MLEKLRKIYTRDHSIWSILVIIVGSITWSLTMVKSGLCWDALCASGVGFWGPNGHDGIWHIAVSQSLANGSWEMPIFAGELLKNYHVGFNLTLAVLHKLTQIPIHYLYFQILPPIIAVGVGLSSYYFVLKWKESKMSALWAAFFVYFGGNFAWIITLFQEGRIGGESMFWSQQSISTLINPPFALSLILFFVGLTSLKIGIDKNDKRYLAAATIIFGLLIQVKVYAGLLVLGGLLVSGMYFVIAERSIKIIRVFVGSAILSLLLYLPMNSGASSSVVFKPFWLLETMMQFSDRVGWTRYGEAMINYRLAGNFIKGIPAYTIAFLIFLIGNFGTRILAVSYFVKNLIRKNFQYIDVLEYSMISAGIVLPMFFVQKGTPWNTIQFFYYSLILSGLLAGIFVAELMTNAKMSMYRYIAIFIIVLFTIPTTIGTLWFNYLPSRPPAKLSIEELEALEFLKNQPDGVVLTMPFDRDAANAAVDNPPRPLYLYESTAYVSAFSAKSVYLEDEINLEITGYDWRSRRDKVEEVFGGNDTSMLEEFLRENNITYVYLTEPNTLEADFEEAGLEKVFKNEESTIYKKS